MSKYVIPSLTKSFEDHIEDRFHFIRIKLMEYRSFVVLFDLSIDLRRKCVDKFRDRVQLITKPQAFIHFFRNEKSHKSADCR